MSREQTDIELVVNSPLYIGGDTSTLQHAVEKNKKMHQLREAGREYELSMRELESTIELYFEMCLNRNKTPTPAGLCNSIGVNHKTLLAVLKEDSEKSKIVQDALEVIHSLYQEAVVNGIMPVKTYTFMAKNYWGMTDKEIIEVKTENNDVRVVEIDARLNQLRRLSSSSVDNSPETDENGCKNDFEEGNE